MAATAVLRKTVSPMYLRILSRFPPNVSMCFAYGSGVKEQLGYDKKKKNNMIDLIFCVDNSFRWHAENLDKNLSHYSAMHTLGSRWIARYQEDLAARMYFNTLVPIVEEGRMIKYGVTSTKHLIEDLLDWRYLYVAGRLHKPVKIIRSPTNVKIENAMDNNLKSAMHAALLLLPKSFTEYDFYFTVANLSYGGDFRMTFGENKQKVKNIVRPQLRGFRELYAPTLKLFRDNISFPTAVNHEILCEQDASPTSRLHHLSSLPKWPIRNICHNWNRGRYKQDTEDVLRAVAYSSICQETVQNSLNSIVLHSSLTQSLKNIPTAGIAKSIKYSWGKIQKMLDTSTA